MSCQLYHGKGYYVNYFGEKCPPYFCGTAYQYYAVYEKGTSEIPFERAIALAKYYNVSLDYIAGLTNDKRGLTHSTLTREQQELLRVAEEIASADKTKTIALLKALINTIK